MLGERYREACEQGWLDYPGKEHKETCPFATGLESKYQLANNRSKSTSYNSGNLYKQKENVYIIHNLLK